MNKLSPMTRSKKVPPPVFSSEGVMFLLVQVGQAIEKEIETSLEKAELSGAKFGVLAKLVQAGGPLALSDLAERLTCVRSNITQLVDRLEAERLVVRIEVPGDRRAVQAEITDLGRERFLAGAARIKGVQHSLSRSLSGIDRDALKHLLSILR